MKDGFDRLLLDPPRCPEGVPAPVWRVLERALAKRPADPQLLLALTAP
jgi:hypothetical protein